VDPLKPSGTLQNPRFTTLPTRLYLNVMLLHRH
jgi:hypothetical protein